MVWIEMVPIYHTSAQSLRYIYFIIIPDYLDFFKSFLGLTGYLIRNVCAEFGIYFPWLILIYLCTFKRIIRKQYLSFSTLPITNKPFAQHQTLLDVVLYLLNDVDDNILSVSANMLSTPAIC